MRSRPGAREERRLTSGVPSRAKVDSAGPAEESATPRITDSRALLFVAALLFAGVGHAVWAPPLGPKGGLALHVVGWVPALAVFCRLGGWRAFAAGWLVGTLAQLALFYWLGGTLGRYAGLGLAGALALVLLYALAHGLAIAVFAWGAAPVRRVAGAAWPAALAAWFAACEHWSPQLFPHFQGAWWAALPELFLASAVTGVAGISFLVLWANGVVLLAVETAVSKGARRALAANALILMGALCLAVIAAAWQEARVDDAEARAGRLRVALIQPFLQYEEVTDLLREEPQQIAERLASQSDEALRADPAIDVFVWPEGVLHGTPAMWRNQAALRFAHTHEREVWTGAMTRESGPEGETRVHNSAFRVRSRGRIGEAYHKQRLIPFSESMPGWLPTVREVTGVEGPWGRLHPGESPGLHDTPWARMAFLICYEAILADSVREVAREGADLLVNLTHGGWFGDTSEPHQHLMLARAQAAQVGIPLVRATTTGISALIDARGSLLARGPLFEKATLVGEVRPVRVPSLYAAVGPWFAWACTAVSLALIGRGLLRRRGE